LPTSKSPNWFYAELTGTLSTNDSPSEIFAQMRDWTQDRAGKVVSGDDKSMRRFSEYWTFIKRIGGQDKTTADLSRCPNCGAEMNNINQQGVCEYCDTKISSGNFDWVLCQIDQDESYGQAAGA
jgi:hypothetical protein